LSYFKYLWDVFCINVLNTSSCNSIQYGHSSAAVDPEIISINSMVILAYLALLYWRESLSKISLAFFEAFPIAFILADYSEAAL